MENPSVCTKKIKSENVLARTNIVILLRSVVFPRRTEVGKEAALYLTLQHYLDTEYVITYVYNTSGTKFSGT